MAAPVWYLDTSSLIVLRSLFSREARDAVLEGLSRLVAEGRLHFPPEVVTELERYQGEDNPARVWVRRHPEAVVRVDFKGFT